MTILSHRRSRFRIIAGSLAFLLAIGPLLYWLASLLTFSRAALWICLALFVVNLALGVRALWAAALQPHDFECELSDTAIRCLCPDRGMGSTFELDLGDLLGIEVIGDDPPRIELVTRNGTRYWLTSNFGNPARRFVSHIRSLHPELAYVER